MYSDLHFDRHRRAADSAVDGALAQRAKTRGRLRPLLRALIAASLWLAAVPGHASSAQAVAAGAGHSCALTRAGGVKCWGLNTWGQLGDGTTTARTTPTDVSSLTSGAVAVAVGSMHTCALTTGGGVKCWGLNTWGQLGDGTTTIRTTPTDVAGLTAGVVAITAGGSGGAAHTCALTTGGGLKCWGYNNTGQLGDGTTTLRTIPTDVSGLTSGAAGVVAGSSHTCAVTTSGGVKCWGTNTSGQIGDGTLINRVTPTDVSGLPTGVTAVAAGSAHSCAVTTGGGVKCWGANYYGQLGDSTWTNRQTPTDVVGLVSGVAAVTAGGDDTCSATTGGGVRCWGRNADGELGDGTTVDRTAPADVSGLAGGIAVVATGPSHSCAVTMGGGVRCWGRNDYGQVGDGTSTRRVTPIAVPGLTGSVAGLVTGQLHSCAVMAGGVTCWGWNAYGQLGDGTTANRSMPTAVSGLTTGVTAVAAGLAHTCAVTSVGGVKCWGANGYGQLGDGTMADRWSPADVTGLASGVVAVAVGSTHTCALTTGGGVKCWGGNGRGEVGDGTTTQRTTATDATGLTSGVAAVAAGNFHSCAVTTGGGVKCWGDNSFGQLGDGTTSQQTTPTDVAGLASGVAAVAAGYGHTCVVMTGGSVKCWGNNYDGEVGDGTTTQRTTPTDVVGLASGVTALGLGLFHTCAVTTGGDMACWGRNSDGQLGDGTTVGRVIPTPITDLTGITAADGGERHTCALTGGGGLKCWGDGSVGQLGDPRFGPHLTPVRALGFGQSDFDRDDLADVAVYRPSAGTWFSLDSSTANSSYRHRGWGVQAQGDVPVPGDYDGDGVIDPTVYRPGTGTWFTLKSSSNYVDWTWLGWGVATDTPVPGDYDGDGKADVAVYHPSTGWWFVRPSSGASPWSLKFGDAGDVPVPGDYDGDLKTDLAVYRPATGTWFVATSSALYTAWWSHGWGVEAQGDVPAPGDYDGDGKSDLCVFRHSTGTWFILESHADRTTWSWIGWGTTGDTPAPADYDGDGKTDVAVYRPSTGQWFIKPSGGATQWSVVFGQSGDVPLLKIR